MAHATQTGAFAEDRQNMVDFQLRARGITGERVLQAMARVPRHEFVPESFWDQAYEDHPLPIGEGQTVSQPYIVALMLEALALFPSDKVLEVGTGSGYVAALLGQLSAEVYSIERYPGLAQEAVARLDRLGCKNVKVIVGDGSAGLPAHAPFDAILVSAAAPQIPPALMEQLRPAGRIVIPVGPPNVQELQLIRKNPEGRMIMQRLEGCCFVPLVGRQGYPSA